MQKSMVHELNNLASSQFINNRSTFISTAFNEGDFELRKSRIQNLPSYRKEDLSGRVNFVVVFQTIEIQRLSNEVEALRIALKDEQRQGFNVKSYQVQIRELTERCFAYESEREEYREEITKLNMICQKLYEELEQIRIRYEGLDPTIRQKYRLEKQRARQLEEEMEKWKTSKSREMEDMKLMMENQRKSIIDREIKELTLRFGMQRQGLEKEVRKLRDAMEGKDTDLQRLTSRISQLEILNQELRQYEHTIDDYENKFAMLSQQTMRLNDLLRRKQEEIDRLASMEAGYKRRASEMERKIGQLEEGGGEKAKQLEGQLREWRSKFARVEDENKEYKKELAQVPEFKQAIQQINVESEKLRDAVRQKMGEIDTWKSKYQNLDSEYRQHRSQEQKKIPQLENRVGQLSSENDRLNNILKTRTTEIENWKTKIAQIERQLGRYAMLQQDKKKLEDQLSGNLRIISELQNNVKQYEGQVRRLGEVEKELAREKGEKDEARRQMSRLNTALRSSSQKMESMQQRCQNLQSKLQSFTQIQEELRIHKQKQSSLTKELDRINGIIVQKIKQIQALKDLFGRFEAKLGQYQGLEKKLADNVGRMQGLMGELDLARKEAAGLQDKLIGYESEAKRLGNEVFSLNQEREQLTKLITSRTQELQASQAEVSQLQTQVTRLNSLQSRLLEVEQKYKTSESKLAQATRRLKSQQSKSMQYSQKLEQTTSELLKLKREGSLSPKFKQEYTEVIRQNMAREKEIKNLQARIAIIEGLLRKMREGVARQEGVVRKNAEKLGVIAQKFDISTQAYKKMFQLQTENLKLNEQNMELESKVRVINVQNETLKISRGVSPNANLNFNLNPSTVQTQTFIASSIIGNNYSSKLDREIPKSPIDMLATKRSEIINSEYGSPAYNKSGSVGKTPGTAFAKGANPNVNASSPVGYGNKQGNAYGYGYGESYGKASPRANNANSYTNVNSYNNSYTYNSVDPTVEKQGPGETGYSYNYTYSTSLSNPKPSQPQPSNPSNSSPRLRSNANFNQSINNYNYNYTSERSGAASGTAKDQGYGFAFDGAKAYGENADLDRKRHEREIDAAMDIGQGRAYQRTNYEVRGTQEGQGTMNINFEAFGKKTQHSQSSQNIGVKPAVVPFQFKTTTTRYEY